MEKSTTRIWFFFLVAAVFILIGCRRGDTLLVAPPYFAKSLEGHIKKEKVYAAYKAGLMDALGNNGKQDGPSAEIRISFIFKDKGVAGKLSAMRPEEVRDFIKSRDGNGILYCEILQPDETIPFAYCKIHGLCVRSGLRAHQFTGLLLHLPTFYSEEYWKAEFREILERIRKIL